MPFSLKRLTQMHRSTSLPAKGGKPGSDNENKRSSDSSSGSGSNSALKGINKGSKYYAMSGSRSMDASEIRRLSGQITISDPIPINPPPINSSGIVFGVSSNVHGGGGGGGYPIRMSKGIPLGQSPRSQTVGGYYTDAVELSQVQQRRMMTMYRQQSVSSSGGSPTPGGSAGHSQHHPKQLQFKSASFGGPVTNGNASGPVSNGNANGHVTNGNDSGGHANGGNSGGRSMDASEVRRLSAQITISDSIPINPPGGSGFRRNSSAPPARSSSETSNSTTAQNSRGGGTNSSGHQLPNTNNQLSSQQLSGIGGRGHHTLPHNHHNQHLLYYPSNFVPSSLFDDDPGIMSEVETSATGFRRSIKSRSSLPIVRTPSKTQDRSLGLVFLQYRNETKRALLPNEITSMDTVKALFVRSFPKQLSMDYLDSRHVRIYIHDPAKDMFYELEDLRDIRDRSVLRIYEQDVVNGAWLPVGGATPVAPQHGGWMDNDPSYFSEPEFDSEYQNQHIHRANRKASSPTSLPISGAQSQYYGTVIMASQYRGQSAPGRGYAPPTSGGRGQISKQPPQPPERTKPYPERRLPGGGGETVGTGNGGAGRSSFPPPGYNMSFDDSLGYSGTYGPRSGSTTPVVVDEEARIRMEQMERQLASLTGLVQKALTPGQQQQQQQLQQQQLQQQLSRTGPTGSEQRDKPSKPAPPPKPPSLVGYRGSADGSSVVGSLHLSAEMFNQLRQLKKKTKDLRLEVRNLKRMAQSQASIAKDTLKESCVKIKASLAFMNIGDPIERQLRFERLKLCKDEESYKTDVNRLEKDLSQLESQVEELRSNVINRRCRVNMTDVESMALVLSRASKTVADLKTRYPHLQEVLKTVMAQEMEYVVREEKFLKSEPDRLESALRRCKKLTGTLVTLKRLASVQEQRSTTGAHPGAHIEKSVSADSAHDVPHSLKDPTNNSARTVDVEPNGTHTIIQVTPATPTLKSSSSDPRHENALDALLDELQTFSKPVGPQTVDGQKRKFGSFDGGKKTVPQPPPRSSSRVTDPQEQARQLMLLSSLTAAAALANARASGQTPTVVRSNSEPSPAQMQQLRPRSTPPENIKSASSESVDSQDGNPFAVIPSASISSLSSVDSQGSVIENGKGGRSRQQMLEERHQELLKKQKLLQEQYTRLQLLSRGQIPKTLLNDLKKTGSESNILMKSAAMNAISGSLTQLALNKLEEKNKSKDGKCDVLELTKENLSAKKHSNTTTNNSSTTGTKHETQKIYETDIL